MSTSQALPPRSNLRAALRLLAFILLPLVFFLPVLALWFLRFEGLRSRLVHLFYRCACVVCGVRLNVEGQVSNLRPLMLVANHSSYLDIFIFGALTRLSFTPKKEIRSWPIIGFFCVLADCVFIERKPADIQRAQAEMAARLQKGKVLVLFPEGTTGDGFEVKAFKSGFLSLAEAYDLPLQPVTLAYTHIGRQPLSAETREHVAWIGEATLVDHLFRLFSFPSITVTAHFHEVERIGEHGDRKALAVACKETIETGLKRLLEENGVTG